MLMRARKAAPREIVGVILSDGSFEELENAWPEPGGFSLTEEGRARAAAADVAALVHSHPTDLPIPSGLDHAGATRNSVHAILSLAPAALRAWRLLDGQALPVPVEIA